MEDRRPSSPSRVTGGVDSGNAHGMPLEQCRPGRETPSLGVQRRAGL